MVCNLLDLIDLIPLHVRIDFNSLNGFLLDSTKELFCPSHAASYRSVDRIVGFPNVDRREQT